MYKQIDDTKMVLVRRPRHLHGTLKKLLRCAIWHSAVALTTVIFYWQTEKKKKLYFYLFGNLFLHILFSLIAIKKIKILD